MESINMPTIRPREWTALVERIPVSHEALSLGAWLLAILAAEVAIHAVGEPIRSAMPLFLVFTGVIAVLAGQRYWHTGLPHWLLASFAATLITLNGFQYAYLNFGVTLHDVHLASDTAALATAFFLLVESFAPGGETSRTASLASLLACCGFLIIIPALLFGLGPVSLDVLLTLITSEGTSTVLSVPIWVPFTGLVPAVVGLYLGNVGLQQKARRDGLTGPSSEGASGSTSSPHSCATA